MVAYSLGARDHTVFLGAFILLCGSPSLRGSNAENAKLETVSKYVAAAVAVTIVVGVAGHMAATAYSTLTVGKDPAPRDQVTAAIGLESMGLRAGDPVAVIGAGQLDHWARLGRFRIVAEAEYAERFWVSSPERRNLAYECLSRTGARGVIARDPPSSSLDNRWKRISGTRYYAYFFRR